MAKRKVCLNTKGKLKPGWRFGKNKRCVKKNPKKSATSHLRTIPMEVWYALHRAGATAAGPTMASWMPTI